MDEDAVKEIESNLLAARSAVAEYEMDLAELERLERIAMEERSKIEPLCRWPASSESSA